MRLYFTIRDVLWLMVVVGMGMAWWLRVARHKQIVRSNDGLMEEKILRRVNGRKKSRASP
jgi:hypothetical protein